MKKPSDEVSKETVPRLGLLGGMKGPFRWCGRFRRIVGTGLLLTFPGVFGLGTQPVQAATFGSEGQPAWEYSNGHHQLWRDHEMPCTIGGSHGGWIVILLLVAVAVTVSKHRVWHDRRVWRRRDRRWRGDRPWSEGWDEALARARAEAGFGKRTVPSGAAPGTDPPPLPTERAEAVPSLEELETRLARLNRRIVAMESEVTDGAYDWERRFRAAPPRDGEV